MGARGTVADQGADVHRGPDGGEAIEVAREALPGPLHVAGEEGERLAQRPAQLRAHGGHPHAAVAHHERCYALADHAFRARVDQKREIRVGVHVDEPRADHLPAGVHALAALRSAQVADSGDAAIAHAEIGPDTRLPRAINHFPANKH